MRDVLWTRVSARLARAPEWNEAECVVVAVSGGADSMTMLHLLRNNLAPSVRHPLHVAHLNHRLRGADSEADAAFVRDTARAWKLPATIHHRDVGAVARNEKKNLEATGRRERYEFLRRVARATGASLIVTGHTMTDQAETVLLRLLRGAGVDGLAGVRPVRALTEAGRPPIFVVRPLLDVSRAEVQAYVRRWSVPFREDASNADASLSRNRLRLRAFPALESVNPKAAAALARLAERAGEDARYFSEVVAEWLATHAVTTNGEIRLPVDELTRTPPAVRRRIVHSVAQRPDFPAIAAYHVAQIADVLLAPDAHGKRVVLPGEREVRRVGRHLVFQTPEELRRRTDQSG
jgi:tRNA(Ile)-lysidine synthase